MPMRPENQRTFHRCLFAGWNETVTLRKRNDDMDAFIITDYVLYDVLPGMVTKTGEPIAGQMTSNHRRTFHVPRIELDRVGVHYISPLDQFVDKEGRYWQPESTTQISIWLGQQHVDVDCLLTDPPVNNSTTG